jgi:predicted nucleic acid-binding protein
LELADTSAWTCNRGHATPEFDQLVVSGEIASCDPVDFELLWTTGSLAEFDALRARLTALRHAPTEPVDWKRAADVWAALVRRGRHRQASRFDLLIAAVAERAGWPVVHYDRHFELIAEVTGQPMRPLAPLGSLG